MVQAFLDHLQGRAPAGGCRALDESQIRDLLLRTGELEIGPYRVFQEEGYGRNRVHLCEDFELAVICWRPGQASTIHDHGRSICAYLVVEGEMTEDVFESVGELQARKLHDRRFGAGEVMVAAGHHIHRIRNGSDSELVTVHLYTPPMADSSQDYSEQS